MRLLVGSPCYVLDYTGQKVKAIIHYVGRVRYLSGVWVGVGLDRPDGDSDGVLKGKRYFTVASNHATFRPAENVIPVLVKYLRK